MRTAECFTERVLGAQLQRWQFLPCEGDSTFNQLIEKTFESTFSSLAQNVAELVLNGHCMKWLRGRRLTCEVETLYRIRAKFKL